MTELNSAQAGEVLIKASYVARRPTSRQASPASSSKSSAYFQRYGDKSDALARIVKAHRNGAKNHMHFQKNSPTSSAAIPRTEPFVAGPLKRTDCSPVTDGAAAVVLTTFRRRSA